MKAILLIKHPRQKGTVLIISMIFLVVFSALAVSMATMSGTNVQLAENQHKSNSALFAAQSGLECAKYIVNTIALEETGSNFVSDTQANQVWSDLSSFLSSMDLDGKDVGCSQSYCGDEGTGDQIIMPAMDLGGTSSSFAIRFYRYDNNLQEIKIECSGTDGPITKRIGMDMDITKDSEVLSYAIASRGRMWLTGDTTVYGDIFSSWNRPEISPFNMTSESRILGSINTVLDLDDILDAGYQMETLNEDGFAVDANWLPLCTNYDDRYCSEDDEIQGYHENINYDQPYEDMPGMDISDYDTDGYNSGLYSLASSANRQVEYFPHASGDYTTPRDGTTSSTWNRRLTRHIYDGQTLTNVRLPDNRNALFKDCTFEGVLYIDCYKSGSSYYNNVRFEDCTFNGVIVTDVPRVFKWQHNVLYFTGEANFNNTSDIQEATVLAPHFNVNLGNTNPNAGDNNVLTGAIVGGIVDVRGNAQINGTIISMCDTSNWSSGYVTNIGATLDDGGSETTELGDIGTIEITPEEDQLLPSGITTPIIIRPQQNTYYEGV